MEFKFRVSDITLEIARRGVSAAIVELLLIPLDLGLQFVVQSETADDDAGTYTIVATLKHPEQITTAEAEAIVQRKYTSYLSIRGMLEVPSATSTGE